MSERMSHTVEGARGNRPLIRQATLDRQTDDFSSICACIAAVLTASIGMEVQAPIRLAQD